MKPTKEPRPKLTQEKLKENLRYNPNTGVFTRIVKISQNATVGQEAGTLCNGYNFIGVNGKRYYAHRLAFLYMEGYLPENEVDHINRNRLDNRWANLRHVSGSCNVKNVGLRSTNKSGVTGVQFDKSRNNWSARIYVSGKNLYLGRYKLKIDAVKARHLAEIKHGFTDCNANSTALSYLKKEGVI